MRFSTKEYMYKFLKDSGPKNITESAAAIKGQAAQSAGLPLLVMVVGATFLLSVVLFSLQILLPAPPAQRYGGPQVPRRALLLRCFSACNWRFLQRGTWRFLKEPENLLMK